MALHDRIFKTGRIATVTLATSATLDRDNVRTVATVATVSVASGEEKEIDSRLTDRQPSKTSLEGSEVRKDSASTPVPCQGCTRLKAVEILGSVVNGCLYIAPGQYFDGWRRLPADLTKCLFH